MQIRSPGCSGTGLPVAIAAPLSWVPLMEPGSTSIQLPSGSAASTACRCEIPGSVGGPVRSISGAMPRDALRRPIQTSRPVSRNSRGGQYAGNSIAAGSFRAADRTRSKYAGSAVATAVHADGAPAPMRPGGGLAARPEAGAAPVPGRCRVPAAGREPGGRASRRRAHGHPADIAEVRGRRLVTTRAGCHRAPRYFLVRTVLADQDVRELNATGPLPRALCCQVSSAKGCAEYAIRFLQRPQVPGDQRSGPVSGAAGSSSRPGRPGPRAVDTQPART